jgi:hypothetical protein
MMKDISRRSLLAGITAAAPVAIAPSFAANTAADPVLSIAREWWQIENAANSDVPDDECTALVNAQKEPAWRLYHTLSATIRGLEAKLLILGHDQGKKASDDIDGQKYNTDKLLISILRDVERLAGRETL